MQFVQCVCTANSCWLVPTVGHFPKAQGRHFHNHPLAQPQTRTHACPPPLARPLPRKTALGYPPAHTPPARSLHAHIG
eukprot:355627-Chlamydomonas_euryale.AAC.14